MVLRRKERREFWVTFAGSAPSINGAGLQHGDKVELKIRKRDLLFEKPDVGRPGGVYEGQPGRGSPCARFLPGHSASAQGSAPPSLSNATADASAGRIMCLRRPATPPLINYSRPCTLEPRVTAHARHRHGAVNGEERAFLKGLHVSRPRWRLHQVGVEVRRWCSSSVFPRSNDLTGASYGNSAPPHGGGGDRSGENVPRNSPDPRWESGTMVMVIMAMVPATALL